MSTLRIFTESGVWRGIGLPDELPASTIFWDYTDTNKPWACTTTTAWEQRLPAGVPVVDLSTSGATFWDRLNDTVNSRSGRFICRLPAGRHILTSFRLIGSSGDPSYSFGFWFPKLAGFLGPGADVCSIEMAPNSMTQAQLDKLATMTASSFAPNQMSLCRIDSSEANPAYLGGLTFRSANQNQLTAKASDVSAVIPQPAPHQGPTLYSDSIGLVTVSHVRFEGAGKAWTSAPPFEMANVTSLRSKISWFNCEFDGRLASVFDPNRPRKCGPWMGNKEYLSAMTECWLHHSNVSRYAANDENQSATGRTYTATRTKIEQITNTQNDGNGGFTNATPFGWESTNAEIVITDCIVVQDNPRFTGQIPQHLQLTSVGGFNPAGGRLRVRGGIFRNNGFPTLNGFLCIRATASHWVSDGYDTTMFIYPNADGSGTRKQPWNYTGTWPPTAAQIAAAGVTPATHYLVRS